MQKIYMNLQILEFNNFFNNFIAVKTSLKHQLIYKTGLFEIKKIY